jgi:hypothetical protein
MKELYKKIANGAYECPSYLPIGTDIIKKAQNT